MNPVIQAAKDAVHAAETIAERAVAMIHALVDGAQTALDADDTDALNDILATAKATADELGSAVAAGAPPAADPAPADAQAAE